MKSMLSIAVFLFVFTLASKGQSKQEEPSHPPIWTEADRNYLLENLKRSKAELLEETQNLSQEQWNFKEDQDRWSINQIVEHLAIYELIFLNDISVALQVGEFPQIKKYAPDSLFMDQDPEGLNQKLHQAIFLYRATRQQ